jgi:hypothetical protein
LAAIEASDLEELVCVASYLLEMLCAYALKAVACTAAEEAEAETFLEMARVQEEGTQQAAEREEVERKVAAYGWWPIGRRPRGKGGMGGGPSGGGREANAARTVAQQEEDRAVAAEREAEATRMASYRRAPSP